MERILFTLPLTELSIERSLKQYLLQHIPFQDKPDSLTFYTIQTHDSIIYQCPVAIQLAKGNPKEAQHTSHQILSNLKLIKAQFSLEISVTLNPYSLLEFSLNYQVINQWLCFLPKLLLTTYKFFSRKQPIEPNDEFFALQYAHARCCSLLRLGHLDHLIQLQTLDFHYITWFWLSPEPIPFEKILWQLEERELIEQIIKFIDRLDSLKSMKLAEDLSKAFLKFEQSCRIWGEVKRHNLTLAQARLGLVAIVQLLLKFLLTEKLGVIPLIEL